MAMRSVSSRMGVVALCGIALLSSGCIRLTPDDIVGKWKSKDGAVLVFDSDGKVFATKLIDGPVLHLDRFESHDGVGTWKISNDMTYREVEIDFSQIAEYKNGYGTQVHVSGYGSMMRLYWWVGEEGGDRYEFTREN